MDLMGIRIGLLNTGRLGSFVLVRESDFDICLRFCPGSGLSQSICFFATPVLDELRAEIASKFDSAVFFPGASVATDTARADMPYSMF